MPSTLLKNITEEQGCLSAVFDSTLFKKPIPVHGIESQVPLAYMERCAQAFNALSPAVLQQLYQCSYDYYIDCCEWSDEVLPTIERPEDILQHLSPLSMQVPAFPAEYNAETAEPIMHLHMDCDWEFEHGMGWLIRGEDILYVSSCDGLPEWKDEEYYRNLESNFAFGNKL
ncbi:hypothetical protein SK066_17080 [Paenibacillus hunanensis]|uniref:DUF6985 domain-containing protein n=1 Tax=Paenibacillus hunanensis TaxID=539262 RepID=UPI002A6989F5|nr:hypothetical protein [Paenibacillus hunanensis]WPP40308.1 hypothetical protein SK066_17080 [Paenibacillus hunanensis]